MTEFDAILEDIRANPADDLPRLALADWLMEQDDTASRSRGEFIHARCRAASLPPRDSERLALQLRAEALREEHEIEWLGGLAEHLDSWDFERGMIVAGLASQAYQRQKLARQAFSRLTESDGWKWVIGVRGRGLSGVDLTALFKRQQLQAFTSIELRHCEFSPAGIRALADSRHLTRLASLDLGYTSLKCEGIRKILEHPRFPSLRIFLVDNNGISADGVQALAASTDLPQLMRLDLSRNPIEDRGASTFARYCQFEGLKELRLASCGIGNRGGVALATSNALANLNVLDLSDNPLDEGTRDELRERFGDRVRFEYDADEADENESTQRR